MNEVCPRDFRRLVDGKTGRVEGELNTSRIEALKSAVWKFWLLQISYKVDLLQRS